MDDSEARKARAERLREEIDALTNPPGDPGMIPGLRKALELAEQYRTYDLQNAEKLLDAEDQDRALNCSMRMGQFMCILQEAIRRLETKQPLPNPPVEVYLFELPGIVKFAQRYAPPNMQQDDQDFQDWLKSGWGTGYYFSWPRGERATFTVLVNLRTKEVTFTTTMTEQEAGEYKKFAEDLKKHLGW